MRREEEKCGQRELPTAEDSLASCLHKLSLVVLALLLPLAFLLLARLNANPLHLLPFPASTFLRVDLLLVLSFLFSVCVATLLNTILSEDDGATRGRTGLAWAFLCVFQLCVGLGVETAIAAGVEPARRRADVPSATWARLAAFFLGVYEATLFWVRTFVRPVVDDAIFRAPSCEGARDRVAVGAAFSALWLWTLANEVDGLLAVVVGLEGGPPMAAARRWYGFVLWMVINVTVATGVISVARGFMRVGNLLLLRARGREDGDEVELLDSYYKVCEV